MDKVWATLRTFGVLLGLWVILAVVGIITGVVPIAGLHDAPAEEADPDVATAIEPDGGTDGLDAGPAAIATSERDGGAASAAVEDEASEAPPATEVTRWSVCPASEAEPSLTVGHVFGDDRPEIIVGCPEGWHVLGLSGGAPTRIAVFSTGAPPAEQRARSGAAAIGDVDGDGLPDVVLPLAYETDNGASRGGGLFWVPRSAYGGIRDPLALAPIAAVDAAIAVLDANAGADIVAMNRANALAQLPSEAWVFGGGAAPARLSAQPTGLGGIAVRAADIDRDGRTDVIALSRGRVDLHFGDGQGRFPRSHTFELDGAREIAVGDLDGDGGADLAVLGNGLRWIRAGAIGGMEPRGVDGVPATLRGLQIVDVDGDGKLDFVGWDHPRLAVLRHQGEVAFQPETGLTLVGAELGPRRHRIADLDGDGTADDLALLGSTSGPDGALELLLVIDALDGAELTPDETPRSVPNAPLVLRAAMPR